MSESGYVKALLHEREGYRMARMWDRMRQVDAELARFGIAVEDEPETTVDPRRHRGIHAVEDDTPEAAVERPPEKRPRGRPRKTA